MWPIRGCAAGQSVVRVQNLDTRHKRAIIKRHLISTNRDIHLYIIQIKTPGGGGGVGGEVNKVHYGLCENGEWRACLQARAPFSPCAFPLT